MLRSWPPAAVFLLAAAAMSGCGPSGVREQTFQNQNAKGLDRARAILQNYANGSPMTSEASP
jgi:hypothetical protein